RGKLVASFGIEGHQQLHESSRLLKKFNARSILSMFARATEAQKDDRHRYWWGISGDFASSSALPTDSSRCGEKLRDADEIVGRSGQDEEPFDQAAAAMTGLAKAAERLDPAERFLDLLAFDGADPITGVPCRAPIDRRATVGIV